MKMENLERVEESAAPPKPLTHEMLRIAALKYARNRKYDYAKHECNGFGLTVIASEAVTAAGDIPDVIGWRNGFSWLIECKASRSDYLVDAKKPQRLSGTGMGNRRYFFTPDGLLSADEIPSGWGLIECDGKTARIIKAASQRELDGAAHADEKKILLSLLRRIRMREFLIIQKEEFLEVGNAG